MHLTSTRDRSISATFEEAIFKGLAPDGGLYEIAETPDLTEQIRSFSEDSSFLDIAATLTGALLGDELGPGGAEAVCSKAFSFIPKLRPIEQEITLLELFHGPSCAFKDFGAAFLAAIMEHFLSRTDEGTIVLTATSGDTGSAVAQAFKTCTNIDVVVLYPSGRVSPLQEKQLTTVGGNVHAVEVAGSFDDCQRMVKDAFLDTGLRAALPLTSANSINIGRLIPQAYYYIYASVMCGFGVTDRDSTEAFTSAGLLSPSREHRTGAGDKLVMCVPSGNFGNLTAGVMARSWGMYCDRFIAATNTNDVVPEYLRTALFSPRRSVKTYSNAMDVGNPSNFERLSSIFNGDHTGMADVIRGDAVSDSETLEEIRRSRKESGAFLCPHTAVGIVAARRFLGETGHTTTAPENDRSRVRVVSLATAHPGKFSEVIEEATGERPELPERLKDALTKKKSAAEIGNTIEALKRFLLDTFSTTAKNSSR